jgi:hypothetical protein
LLLKVVVRILEVLTIRRYSAGRVVVDTRKISGYVLARIMGRTADEICDESAVGGVLMESLGDD